MPKPAEYESIIRELMAALDDTLLVIERNHEITAPNMLDDERVILDHASEVSAHAHAFLSALPDFPDRNTGA